MATARSSFSRLSSGDGDALPAADDDDELPAPGAKLGNTSPFAMLLRRTSAVDDSALLADVTPISAAAAESTVWLTC